jgi:hypothetical protein
MNEFIIQSIDWWLERKEREKKRGKENDSEGS